MRNKKKGIFMKKKNTVGIMVFAITILILCSTAYATDEIISGLFSYRIENGTAIITKYNWESNEGDVYIPQMLDGYTVTGIGKSAFTGGNHHVAIVIPGSITSIDDFAFAHSAINIINIPASVQSIGNGILMDCNNLSKIILDPANKNYAVYDDALYEKAAKKLVASKLKTLPHIPDGIKEIGDYVFSGQRIPDFDQFLPTSVTTIGNHSFEFAYLFYSNQNERWLVPKGVVSIGEYAFESAFFYSIDSIPPEKGGNIVHLFNDLVYLGKGAYRYAYILCASSVDDKDDWTVDNSIVCTFGHVDVIPDEAFYLISPNNHIVWYITGPSYQYVGNRAFGFAPDTGNYIIFKCSEKYKNVYFESMGKYVFENARVYGTITVYGDNLKANTFSDMQRLTSENEAFLKYAGRRDDYYYQTYRYNEHELWIYLAYNTTEIPNYAFKGCFYEVSFTGSARTLRENLTKIGEGAFQGSALQLFDDIANQRTRSQYKSTKYTVNLSSYYKITVISRYAFADTSDMWWFKFPPKLYSIEDYAFSNSGIRDIVFPDTLTSIGEYAFEGCNDLKEVFIPVSVTNIGKNAFDRSITTLIVEKNSYAETWASENYYSYRYVESEGNELDWLNN